MRSALVIALGGAGALGVACSGKGTEANAAGSGGSRAVGSASSSASSSSASSASSASSSSSGGSGGSSTTSASSSSTAASSSSATSGCSIGTSSSGAIVGYAGIGGSTIALEAGAALASRFVAVQDGLVGHISAYVESGTTTELLLGVYDEENGRPATLLTWGTVDNPALGGWVTATVSPAVPLSAGSAYWLVLLSPASAGSFGFAYRTDPCSYAREATSLALKVPPDPWPFSQSQNVPLTQSSFYASP